MALSAVATPYATALLDLAVAQGTLPAVRAQLDKVSRALAASPELRVAFSNPTISTDDRKKVVTGISSQLILSRTTKNFLLVLAEKGRLGALTDIVTVLNRLADERTGATRAVVTSPKPLDGGQLTRLKAALAKLTGKTVSIDAQVDPQLIGGLQVAVDGKVYDTSVATQLKQLRDAILTDL